MDYLADKFLRRLLKMAWLVVLLGILGLAAGAVFSLNSAVTYSASATLISLNTDKTSILGNAATMEDLNLSRRIANDYQDIARSSRVAAAASRKLADAYDLNLSEQAIRSMVRVTHQTDSNILTLGATAARPDVAIAVSNAVAQSLVEEIKSLTGTAYFNILDNANTVTAVSRVNMTMALLFGLLGGLLAGLVLVYVLTMLDPRIHSVGDINENSDVRVMVIPEHSIK